MAAFSGRCSRWPENTFKQMYGHAFGIYALAANYRAHMTPQLWNSLKGISMDG